jgi:hypothetical protein
MNVYSYNAHPSNDKAGCCNAQHNLKAFVSMQSSSVLDECIMLHLSNDKASCCNSQHNLKAFVSMQSSSVLDECIMSHLSNDEASCCNAQHQPQELDPGPWSFCILWQLEQQFFFFFFTILRFPI